MGHKPPQKRPNIFPVSPALARYRDRHTNGTVNHSLAHKPTEGTPEYEAYRDRMRSLGRLSGRTGIPHGWGGRRQELHLVREAARQKARDIVAGAIESDQVDTFIADNTNARTAMEYLVSVVVARDAHGMPAESTADRIKAAGQILQYTKAKPSVSGLAKVQTAEDWLTAVVAV